MGALDRASGRHGRTALVSTIRCARVTSPVSTSSTRSASMSEEYSAIVEANRMAQDELYWPPYRVRPLFWEQRDE